MWSPPKTFSTEQVSVSNQQKLCYRPASVKKKRTHLSCKIDGFVETQLSQSRVISRSRVLRDVYVLMSS